MSNFKTCSGEKFRKQYVLGKDENGEEKLIETEPIDIQQEIESYADECDIKNIVNLSREPSLAVVDVDFPYDVPIEYIEKLFDDKFAGLKDKIPGIITGPFYKGVTEYKDSNVTVKIVATCLEEDRFQVQRDLLREYRAIITAEGIDISYPHVVIGQDEKSNIKISKKDVKVANQFVEEQKDLSIPFRGSRNQRILHRGKDF